MSARDYMDDAALDAYLDARDAYASAVREAEIDLAIRTPDWIRRHTVEEERDLANARCALEREVEALHGKS